MWTPYTSIDEVINCSPDNHCTSIVFVTENKPDEDSDSTVGNVYHPFRYNHVILLP